MHRNKAHTLASVALVVAIVTSACNDPEPQARAMRGVVPPNDTLGNTRIGNAGGSPNGGNAGAGTTPEISGAAENAGHASIAGSRGAATTGSAGNAIAGNNGAFPPTGAAGTGSATGTATPWADGPVTKQPKLPTSPPDCPQIATGMITILGQQVRLWVGPQKGPMVFYWHGTGSRAEEAISGLGPGLNEIMTQGGVVASFTTSTQMGRTTANGVWYAGDFDMADQILACANAQGLIDPQHIYSAGCSAGGIHTSTMVFARSTYLAAGIPNSGGIVFPTQLQDPSHVPFQMSAHGARDKDVVHAGQANAQIDIYFADITATDNRDLVSKGGFAVNCDHGGEHCATPPALKAAMWQFLKAHQFGTSTSPYASGLPTSFPPYCQIVH